MNDSEIVSVQKPLKNISVTFLFCLIFEFGTLTDLGGTDSGVLASLVAITPYMRWRMMQQS